MFAKLMRHSNGKPQCEGNRKRAHTCIHRNWFTDLAGFAHAREYNFLSVSQRSGLGLTVFHACEPVNNYYPGNPNEDHDCGTRAPEMLRIGCSLFANQQRRMMSKEQNVEITETPQLSEYRYCKKRAKATKTGNLNPGAIAMFSQRLLTVQSSAAASALSVYGQVQEPCVCREPWAPKVLPFLGRNFQDRLALATTNICGPSGLVIQTEG